MPTPRNRIRPDDPQNELAWTRDLFVSELDAVIDRYDPPGSAGLLLLEEAFVGSTAVEEYHAAGPDADGVLRELRWHASELREQGEFRRPYYLHRHQQEGGSVRPNWDLARRRFTTTIRDLDARGYFDKAWGPQCVDGGRYRGAPSEQIQAELELDVDPFDLAVAWGDEVFLSIVEVLHDSVARPRVITRFHDFNDCGRHYGDYAAGPGQAIYRLRMNELFRQTNLPFRLSGAREDYGRVVEYSDDAREDLVHDVVATADPSERDEIAHAIAIFRARGADREAKRSAVLALARILEEHRPLLRTELMSADEDALFTIANKFDIRHRNGHQREDYDTAFLDWIFWTYLASVRLLGHLVDRATHRR